MIFATDIPHFKGTFHKQFIHLYTFDYYLRSEMFLKKRVKNMCSMVNLETDTYIMCVIIIF